MRWPVAFRVAVAAVLAVVAGCSEGGSSGTTGRSPRSTDAASADPARTNGNLPANTIILAPDGIGSVPFGTPAETGLSTLSAVLGPPDRLRDVKSGDHACTRGSSWEDCVPLASAGRIVTWTAAGLDVLLTDANPDDPSAHPGLLHVGGWHVVPPRGDAVLATVSGLRPGGTLADARERYPTLQVQLDDGRPDRIVMSNVAGTIVGYLDWSGDGTYMRAVQTALNAHGAHVTVDGIAGAGTQAAWRAFTATAGLQCDDCPAGWFLPDSLAALEFPPGRTRIASLSADEGG